MPLDPQAEQVIAETNARGLPTYDRLEPDEARRQMRGLAPDVDPDLAVPRVDDRVVPGPAGDIPVRIYAPESDGSLPVTVYFHGGGWVVGDLETHHALCHALAKTSGCMIVSVDYRLAPEHRYPAAIEDAYAATAWVSEHGREIGANGSRLAIAGDSAGGNIAAVVALMARDRAGPRIAHQSLIYPVTDCDFETPSYSENAEGYLLTRDVMKWFWRQYAEPGREREPWASPLRAERLDDLPPALVITAGFDPLRDEGVAYARRLEEAGVPVRLEQYDGMIHGFFRMTAVLDRAREALELVAGELRRSLEAAGRGHA